MCKRCERVWVSRWAAHFTPPAAGRIHDARRLHHEGRSPSRPVRPAGGMDVPVRRRGGLPQDAGSKAQDPRITARTTPWTVNRWHSLRTGPSRQVRVAGSMRPTFAARMISCGGPQFDTIKFSLMLPRGSAPGRRASGRPGRPPRIETAGARARADARAASVQSRAVGLARSRSPRRP